MRFEAFSQNFPLVMPGYHQFSSKMDRRIRSGADIVQDERTASRRVNDAPTPRRILHRSGTAARMSSSFQNHGVDCPVAVRLR
jgi:carbamate kinase